jgi:8-oxo-dGTP pyrophosphatase MutT (NUDIX family)
MPHPLLRAHPLLDALAADLQQHPGAPAETDGEPARAAVAMVLRSRPESAVPGPQARGRSPQAASSGPGAEGRRSGEAVSHPPTAVPRLEVLLIQRADRDGDPWSGQVALPGGRRDPSDATLQHTAIRETLEETGLDLDADGHVLGSLDEMRPRTPVLPPIIVTPFVAVTSFAASLAISDEVAEAFWAPWTLFEDPLRVDQRPVQVRGAEWLVDSYDLGGRVIWGMTERMLRQLAERLHRLGVDLHRREGRH